VLDRLGKSLDFLEHSIVGQGAADETFLPLGTMGRRKQGRVELKVSSERLCSRREGIRRTGSLKGEY